MDRTPRAGGFLITASILIGFIAGIGTGNAFRGVLIGTAIGIAIALIIWLVDRRC